MQQAVVFLDNLKTSAYPVFCCITGMKPTREAVAQEKPEPNQGPFCNRIRAIFIGPYQQRGPEPLCSGAQADLYWRGLEDYNTVVSVVSIFLMTSNIAPQNDSGIYF